MNPDEMYLWAVRAAEDMAMDLQDEWQEASDALAVVQSVKRDMDAKAEHLFWRRMKPARDSHESNYSWQRYLAGVEDPEHDQAILNLIAHHDQRGWAS